MTLTTVSVRDVDEDVFRVFKARSHETGLNVGQALTLALQHWMEEHKPKKRFLDFKPSDWGKGTERTSAEVDRVLYGGP